MEGHTVGLDRKHGHNWCPKGTSQFWPFSVKFWLYLCVVNLTGWKRSNVVLTIGGRSWRVYGGETWILNIAAILADSGSTFTCFDHTTHTKPLSTISNIYPFSISTFSGCIAYTRKYLRIESSICVCLKYKLSPSETLSCGASTSDNNTYLMMSNAKSTNSPCDYKVCASSNNICRIRYDFLVSAS